MKLLIISIFLIIFVNYSNAINCGSSDDNSNDSQETKLKKKLFCEDDYDSSLRPAKDHTTTTNITIKMYLKSYDYSDERSTLTINTWLRSSWKDEFLTWDPALYGGLKSTDILSNMIWKGDFSLYNADLAYGTGSCHLTSCLLESDGTVTCVEPCSFVAHCKADYQYWPFDTQNCTMAFGPWMNAGKEIDYVSQLSYISSTESQENTEWRVKSTKSYKKVTELKGKNGSVTTFIPTIYFSFGIERHSALTMKFLTGNVMILVTFNLLSMLMKLDMKERLVILAANVYLHFQVLHQMSWVIPKNGDNTPNALIFFRDSLLITAFIFIETIFLNTLYKAERQPFAWINRVIQLIRDKKVDFILIGAEQNGDEKILIEEPTTPEEVLANVTEDPKPKNNMVWKNIATIFDVLLLIIITISYAIMCLIFIPENYFHSNTIETDGSE